MNPTGGASAENIEKEMDILLARIEEKMNQIRRDREDGEEIMKEARKIAQSNSHALEELGEIIARIK